MCAIKKVTKETLRRPRADVLRTPVPCAPRSVEGRRGNSLRSDTRASSPSPDLRCSARSRRTQGQMLQLHPVDSRHAWMLLLLILTFQSAFKRAEHRRGIRGEEVPMSERSEFGTGP